MTGRWEQVAPCWTADMRAHVHGSTARRAVLADWWQHQGDPRFNHLDEPGWQRWRDTGQLPALSSYEQPTPDQEVGCFGQTDWPGLTGWTDDTQRAYHAEVRAAVQDRRRAVLGCWVSSATGLGVWAVLGRPEGATWFVLLGVVVVAVLLGGRPATRMVRATRRANVIMRSGSLSRQLRANTERRRG